ncbi:MAG: type IV toxin-antitoxin system AbiEi family antitoxin domain-containing protein [Scrofimicrobium sp.]
MSATEITARVSNIAARQWGLLTTAQAQSEGISRLQLARLADAGVLDRVDQGIYAMPSNVDEQTNLRAAWLALDPKTMAEDRLGNPIASGVVSHTSAASLHKLGDLLDDIPEITVASRRQSRRGTRLHHLPLTDDEVTLSQGLPVTTPARTAADLLRDGQDPSHVADIIGEIMQRDLASRKSMAAALDPLASRFRQPDGSSLLEYLLDLVGLSTAALTMQVASSELGKSLVAAGQMDAIQRITQTLNQLAQESTGAATESSRKMIEALTRELRTSTTPQITQPLVRDVSQFMSPFDSQTVAGSINKNLDPALIKLAQQIKQLEGHDNTNAGFSGTNDDAEEG